jgi:hypothetical protein
MAGREMLRSTATEEIDKNSCESNFWRLRSCISTLSTCCRFTLVSALFPRPAQEVLQYFAVLMDAVNVFPQYLSIKHM